MKAKSNNYFEGYSNMESILALQIHGFPWDQMFIIQIQTLNKCTTHSKTKKKASKTISKLQKKKRNLWLLFKVSLVKAVDVLRESRHTNETQFRTHRYSSFLQAKKRTNAMHLYL